MTLDKIKMYWFHRFLFSFSLKMKKRNNKCLNGYFYFYFSENEIHISRNIENNEKSFHFPVFSLLTHWHFYGSKSIYFLFLISHLSLAKFYHFCKLASEQNSPHQHNITYQYQAAVPKLQICQSMIHILPPSLEEAQLLSCYPSDL